MRVNSVIPGFIASSGLDRYPERAHDVLRNVKGKVPLKRHGTESEIAGAIVYLLSPAAAYVTGIALRVDGGLHNNAKSNFYEVPGPRARRSRSTASRSIAAQGPRMKDRLLARWTAGLLDGPAGSAPIRATVPRRRCRSRSRWCYASAPCR